MGKVFLLLPAFNEEGAVGDLLSRVGEVARASGLEVLPVVVDDWSTDRTAELAGRAGAVVIRHGRNMGLGAALRTGLSHILKASSEEDFLVIMDADGTHDPSQIPQMVRLLSRGADIVIASRFVRGSEQRGVPLVRRILSLGSSLLYRFLFPLPGVRDYTCGFRAFRVGLLKRAGEGLLPTGRGFEATTEILLSLRRLRPKCLEVPLRLDYSARGRGSKMRVLRAVREHLLLILRCFFFTGLGIRSRTWRRPSRRKFPGSTPASPRSPPSRSR